MTEPPVLYHLKVSNYNEKARWALDYKDVPHVRRAAVPGRHRKIARRLTGETTFPMPRMLAVAQSPLIRSRINGQFGIDQASVVRALDKLAVAGARFRAELRPSGYLAADRFTVADLTVASLIAPIVAPDGFPYAQPQRNHPRLQPVREALTQYGLADWTRDIYAKERPPSAALHE